MSQKLVSILLLCFESLELCTIGIISNCKIFMVCYGYVVLLMNLITLKSFLKEATVSEG